jgi:hypothetical protein
LLDKDKSGELGLNEFRKVIEEFLKSVKMKELKNMDFIKTIFEVKKINKKNFSLSKNKNIK